MKTPSLHSPRRSSAPHWYRQLLEQSTGTKYLKTNRGEKGLKVMKGQGDGENEKLHSLYTFFTKRY